jgi:hypothetical protein
VPGPAAARPLGVRRGPAAQGPLASAPGPRVRVRVRVQALAKGLALVAAAVKVRVQGQVAAPAPAQAQEHARAPAPVSAPVWAQVPPRRQALTPAQELVPARARLRAPERVQIPVLVQALAPGTGVLPPVPPPCWARMGPRLPVLLLTRGGAPRRVPARSHRLRATPTQARWVLEWEARAAPVPTGARRQHPLPGFPGATRLGSPRGILPGVRYRSRSATFAPPPAAVA